MGENSKIEWTHHTWNLWRGCTEVSPACDHCYARELAKRNPGVLGQWGPGAPRVLAAEAYRALPLKWNAQAVAAGVRRRVFALSMGDWLDDEVPAAWLAELLGMVHRTPQLDWLLLTKRPGNFQARIKAVLLWLAEVQKAYRGDEHGWLSDWRHGVKAPHNVWIGTTVEDQTRAEERIPALLGIPARVRFLSCEPLLGAVDLTAVKWDLGHGYFGDCLSPDHIPHGRAEDAPLIRWVIAGGESGKQARPMHPEWVRSLRDQCAAAQVPFFFKQWGEWASEGAGIEIDHPPFPGRFAEGEDGTLYYRAGKALAGRKLDGREWSEFPTGVTV